MTSLTLLATIVIAALVGSLTALLTEAMRAESRRLTDDMAAIDREVDADRARAHQSGAHRYVDGECRTCGLRADFGRRTL